MSLNQKRISKLRAKLSLSGFDAVFILNPSNTFYLLNSDIEVKSIARIKNKYSIKTRER